MMVVMSIKLSDGSVMRTRNENGSCSVNGASASVRPVKWKPRKVSAVREFPPGCGPMIQPANVVVAPQEPEPVPVSSPVTNAGTDEPVVSVVENLVNKIDNGGGFVIKEGITKMKFTIRRVSAVREFPPFCGPNAKEPTEEDRIRINGGKMIVVSKTGVEDGKTMKLESSKKVQNIGQACKELVVYTRDSVLKKASPVDDSFVSDSDDDIQDNKPLSLVQKELNIKTREVGLKKRVRKRPVDDTEKRVYVGDMIKVVMGIRAPSLTPRVKQEDPNNKPRVKQEDPSNKPKVQALTTPKSSKIKQEKVKKELTEKSKGDASVKLKKPIKKKQKTGAYTGTLEMIVKDEEEDFVSDIEGLHDMDVSLFPYGPKNSNDARNTVRKTLRYFQQVCRKILQLAEAKSDDVKLSIRRIDLAAKSYMDERGKTPVLGEKTYGPVPGVEVGDEFTYRVELALVGIHRPFQGGIDFVNKGNKLFAVSVVASGGYDNEVDKPDCLMYSGSGGIGKDKSYEDQKLERGNLALSNNIELKYPVRVVRGHKVKSSESTDSKSKIATTYIYDGLYTVEKVNYTAGPKGNMVYRFELKRVPGQPQLAIREVTTLRKYKKREGVCVKDISDGKEPFQINAVNTIDDEKPPAFTYITKIMYPDWYKPVPIKGCDCVGRCSDKRCSCAFKNGGEIPYNRNGAIVEAKQLVYECGPSCGCPPSCYNRVTQHGMKIRLEIFKTESRGWGVRSLSSISSGTFICEYVGELLEDTEAEKRVGNDEYLFDIGQNYNDCSVDAKPEEIVKASGGFTIDAAYYGNVGRFINHSCVPNLYAQNVIYDHDDKRMPHIMLFAAENIPPLQELTYHYNYAIDTVHDADGNIKVKNCYCGSSECSGRLY